MQSDQFIDELKALKLTANSRDWRQYETGKAYIRDNKPPKLYTAYIRVLVKYLGL